MLKHHGFDTNFAARLAQRSLSLDGLGLHNIWECLLHVSTFTTTRVALPTGVKPG
jgi:hypothetical protein